MTLEYTFQKNLMSPVKEILGDLVVLEIHMYAKLSNRNGNKFDNPEPCHPPLQGYLLFSVKTVVLEM